MEEDRHLLIVSIVGILEVKENKVSRWSYTLLRIPHNEAIRSQIEELYRVESLKEKKISTPKT